MWRPPHTALREPRACAGAITGSSSSSSTATWRSEFPAVPASAHTLRARSSTTGVGAQPICATTTVFSATTAVPAYVRDRLSDDDGIM